MIQSVIFDKDYWSPKTAAIWLLQHSLHPIKEMHETEYYYRFRIRMPKKSDRYITKDLGNGIKIIISM